MGETERDACKCRLPKNLHVSLSCEVQSSPSSYYAHNTKLVLLYKHLCSKFKNPIMDNKDLRSGKSVISLFTVWNRRFYNVVCNNTVVVGNGKKFFVSKKKFDLKSKMWYNYVDFYAQI